MRLALAFVLLGISPAAAGVVIDNCQITDRLQRFAVCEVTNQTEDAIYSIRFGMKVYTPGSSIPWHDTYAGRPMGTYFQTISGGIERSETVSIIYQYDHLPANADGMEVVAEVYPLAYRSAAGDVTELE
jgi:hypothetical protein